MARVTLTKTTAPGQTVEVSLPQNSVTPPSAPEHSFPSVSAIIMIGALSAVIAWGIVQTIKTGAKGWTRAKQRPEPWYLAAVLRGLSIVVGALAGWLLFDPMGAGGVVWWGAVIGGGGGALATIIVQQIKAKIRGK